MTKNLHSLQWILVIAFLLAFAGMLASMTVVALEIRPWIVQTIRSARQSGTGGQAPHGILPSGLFASATLTPFQPAAIWSPTPSPSPTASPTATATITETPLPPTPTDTPIPTDTLAPTPPPPEENPFPPEEAYITGVVGYAQLYTLDCEARSAVDLAAYFGISIDEIDFLNRLPRSDDPEEGFVGNYWDARGQIPPASYGVHAGPVAALLREYGLNAVDARGLSWDTIRSEIASGRPVMVWVINNTLPGWPVSYTASNGRTTTVAHYQHTVLVTGYNSEYVTILDGDTVYWRTIDQFLNSWSVLGYMAVLIQ